MAYSWDFVPDGKGVDTLLGKRLMEDFAPLSTPPPDLYIF